MKRILTFFAACGLGGLTLAVATQSPPATPSPASPAKQPVAGDLIAHEWGTFTGFAGSDGVHLPFGTLVGSDLPSFVVNRAEQATRQNVKFSINFLLSKGGGIYTLQRMETPVIYFYTDKAREVNVAVDFPKGILTEFYPPVREMKPAFGEGPGEFGAVAPPEQAPTLADAPPTTRPATEAKFEKSSLDWGTVQLIPLKHGTMPSLVPDVPADSGAARHYAYARETDAALVQFSDRPDEKHQEQFLFYRGLGNFALPVTLTAEPGERFKLTNSGEQPIQFALLLRNENGRARFSVYRDIRKMQAMKLPEVSQSVALSQVGDAITQALIAEGLYEKEAKAMVKTWSSSWLGEAGTRVLYTVPRAVTDSLLPLRIAPSPKETVRVLVGRIDVMTPEQESRIQQLLAAAPHTKHLTPEDRAMLRNFGRFMIPAIERAAALRGGTNIEAEAKALRSLTSTTPHTASAL